MDKPSVSPSPPTSPQVLFQINTKKTSEDDSDQKPIDKPYPCDRAFLKSCRNEKRAIYRRLAPFYVSLQSWEVPNGWSNKPDNLWVLTEFAGQDENSAKIALYHKFGVPNARPVLVNLDEEIVIDGGDRRYYAWIRLDDSIYAIQETDLDVIIETLWRARSTSIRSLELELLGELHPKVIETLKE